MANVDKAFGFKLIGSLRGGMPASIEYPVTTSSTALFVGDLADMANGVVIPAATGTDVSSPGVVTALYDSNKKAVSYLATSTSGYASICSDPDAVYEVQADSGTALTSAGSIGHTADHVAGAGDTLTGISGHELDSSNIGTGTQLRIIGKVETPDNTWGEHVNLRVILVEQQSRSVTNIT